MRSDVTPNGAGEATVAALVTTTRRPHAGARLARGQPTSGIGVETMVECQRMVHQSDESQPRRFGDNWRGSGSR